MVQEKSVSFTVSQLLPFKLAPRKCVSPFLLLNFSLLFCIKCQSVKTGIELNCSKLLFCHHLCQSKQSVLLGKYFHT